MPFQSQFSTKRKYTSTLSGSLPNTEFRYFASLNEQSCPKSQEGSQLKKSAVIEEVKSGPNPQN